MKVVANPVGMWVDAMAIMQNSSHCVMFMEAACKTPSLVSALAAFKTMRFETQIKAVNTWVNEHPYVSDMANYNVEDYWATIAEFVSRGGDCEDYAIAKYSLLQALGIAATSMQIVMVYDKLLHTTHAVLRVVAGDKTMILDNQSAEIMDGLQTPRYQALMAVNETGLWQMPNLQTLEAAIKIETVAMPAAGHAHTFRHEH